MSKPRRVDFKALIAAEVAPAVTAPHADNVTPKNARLVQVVNVGSVRKGTLKQRTRQQSLYLEVPVHEALRETAHTERTSMHALLLEGVDAVLRKRGLPSIRELVKATEPVVLSSQDDTAE